MVHYSSSYCYDDPTFCCSDGPPTINTISTTTFFDGSDPSPPFSSSLSSNNYFMHRSSSTTSLTCISDSTPNPFFSSSLSSASDFTDFHSKAVRRAFSTGDLQGMNSIQPSSENCTTARRVGRYSAEERKERIERYRSKRNKRNFGKKITYACRKALADRQPRVRGRFARDEKTQTEIEAKVVEAETAKNIFERYNHNNYDIIDNYSNYDSTGSDEDWWKQLLEPVSTNENEDPWASLSSYFSTNLPFDGRKERGLHNDPSANL